MNLYLSIVEQNLLSAPVLFFCLGFSASVLGASIALPSGVSKMIAIYLMLAIGFKGGAAVGMDALSTEVLLCLLVGVALSGVMPFAAFRFLGLVSPLPAMDRAAIAAHYGSISIVTFTAATDALVRLGLEFSATMAAVAAAMEAPAIISAVYLLQKFGSRTVSNARLRNQSVMREVFFNVTIVVLLGAFAIGAVTGKDGLSDVSGFLVDPFRGVLCLFLLDLGAVAGQGLRTGWRSLRWPLVLFAAWMPALSATLAFLSAFAFGLSHGNAALLMTLAASASYIAAPAAMRMAAPEARPEIYLTMALGVTFPLNLLVGVPLYISLASFLAL
ncbi:MAG TPA: sodium-dependent bicarbonate transport family permease [Ensifer sp.]|jgi:hypothetical protein|uniref:sodium-dependent bicarbonate transport family permease n=1 Tax=Ensifer sp. TaxID=1872086 RepID=UPI002E10138D|nr:sodium-dependent bicarbonate transport family permease [Ensifer sp.]